VIFWFDFCLLIADKRSSGAQLEMHHKMMESVRHFQMGYYSPAASGDIREGMQRGGVAT